LEKLKSQRHLSEAKKLLSAKPCPSLLLGWVFHASYPN
jgi:hypothetical protein